MSYRPCRIFLAYLVNQNNRINSRNVKYFTSILWVDIQLIILRQKREVKHHGEIFISWILFGWGGRSWEIHMGEMMQAWLSSGEDANGRTLIDLTLGQPAMRAPEQTLRVWETSNTIKMFFFVTPGESFTRTDCLEWPLCFQLISSPLKMHKNNSVNLNCFQYFFPHEYCILPLSLNNSLMTASLYVKNFVFR